MEGVLGQNHIKEHFANAIKMNKVSSSYIINGEGMDEKILLAKYFAKSLLCDSNAGENKTGIACENCKSCHQIDSLSHPDLKMVVGEKKNLAVDDIREQINDDVVIKPYNGRYKVYIVDNAQTMNVQAQNALLKTLEEPPEYCVIILLTNNCQSFLQTILSRCVRLDIKPIRESVIIRKLKEEYGVSEYEAKIAASFSDGNLGKAIMLATNESVSDMRGDIISALEGMISGGMDVISRNAERFSEYKDDIEDFIGLIRVYMRDILVYKSTKSEDNIILKDNITVTRQLSEYFSYRALNEIFEEIDKAQSRIKFNVNINNVMEVLLIKIKERMKNEDVD